MAITHKIYNTSILELYIAIYIRNIFFIRYPRIQYNLVSILNYTVALDFKHPRIYSIWTCTKFS